MQLAPGRGVSPTQLRLSAMAENRDLDVAIECAASMYVRAMTERVDWNRWCSAARTMSLRFATLVAVVAPSIAAAQPAATPIAPDIAPVPGPVLADPSVAITISPVHLVVPMAEVTAEIRVAPKVGVALIGGAGAVREETLDELIKLVEVGASVRYYVLGSFRKGLQVGGEVIYVHASTHDNSVMVRAEGLATSPFVGYKWTHASGFTFDGQLGVSFYTLRSDTAEEKAVDALLNLNVGWSF
jgi:hypothetical protein